MATAGNSSSNPSAPVPLDYAPISSRRKKLLKRSILILTLVLASGIIWRWHTQGWTRLQIYYWQWRCLHYSASPDQIVFDENPAEMTALVKQPGYSLSVYPFRNTAAAFWPDCFVGFLKASGYKFTIGQQSIAVCFLGELKTPAGKPRLVVVQWLGIVSRPSYTTADLDTILAEVIEPYTLLGPSPAPKQVFQGLGPFIETMQYSTVNERVYAGQIDPTDPSHFTIRYELWGRQDILDGRLDEKDHVTLSARHMPTTSPVSGIRK